MQSEHKLVSSQQKIVNDFIHFRLIISNIIETKELPYNNISRINAILIKGVVIPN